MVDSGQVYGPGSLSSGWRTPCTTTAPPPSRPCDRDLPSRHRPGPRVARRWRWPRPATSYRLTLSHVDGGRERSESVIVARHPSETQEHLTLRVLAWCLLNEDGLGFGPACRIPRRPDLWTHDLTGRLTTWIECGAASAEKVRKVVLHNTGIAPTWCGRPAPRGRAGGELRRRSLARRTPAPGCGARRPLVRALAAHEDAATVDGDVVGDHTLRRGRRRDRDGAAAAPSRAIRGREPPALRRPSKRTSSLPTPYLVPVHELEGAADLLDGPPWWVMSGAKRRLSRTHRSRAASPSCSERRTCGRPAPCAATVHVEGMCSSAGMR
jgi:hypothetical protein